MFVINFSPARQKLIEGGDGARRGVPMFRTGSGRSVSVSESSIRKARSVLGGGDTTVRGRSTALTYILYKRDHRVMKLSFLNYYGSVC